MSKFLESAKNLTEKSIAKELFEYTKEYGLKRNLCDLVLSKNAIFSILSDGALLKVGVYKHILSIDEYKKYGAPKFHIFGCEELKRVEDGEKLLDYKVVVKDKNSFNFIVRDGNIEVKTIHDKELEFCPFCLKTKKSVFFLKEFFSSMGDVLEEVDLELISINYKRFKNLTCQSCNKKFSFKEIENLELLMLDDSRFLKDGKKLKLICKECLKA